MNQIPIETLYAFVDESGDPSLELDKAGTSQFYIVCALMVNGGDYQESVAEAEAIRQQFFGPSEMKSSKVGGNLQRRREILSAISRMRFKFYAIVINKRDILVDSGLRYKRSFVKYLHGRLYKQLYRSFGDLHVRADEYGGREFMEGFQAYLSKYYKRTFFDREDFQFVSSADTPPIQIADLIAGSLLRVYSGRDPLDTLNEIARRAIIIEQWPPSLARPDTLVGIPDHEKFDHIIAQQAVIAAEQFVSDNYESEDPETEVQVETVRYLMHRYQLDSEQYVHGDTILEYINASRLEQVSLNTFRMRVVARMRSQGVIVASSAKGYKIPNSAADMDTWVSQVDGQVIPNLRRLQKARNAIKLASHGQFDVVSHDRYPVLADCVRALEQIRGLPAEADRVDTEIEDSDNL